MAADLDKPITTDGYEAVLAYLRDNFAAIVTLLDSRGAGASNIPANAKRWNNANGTFESWESSAWVVKAISIAGGGTGATTAANARVALGTNDAANITTGTVGSDRLPTVPVTKGGTGLTTLTSGSFLQGNGNNNVVLRTPAQVWTDLGLGSAAGYSAGSFLSSGAGSVGTSHIADGAITNIKISDYGIGSTKYANGSVGTAALADNQVTGRKVSEDVFGVRDASRNLVIQRNIANGNYQVDVDADEIILQSDSGGVLGVKRVTAVNLTLDITASGANGLDTGTEANSTWYYIWVINNGSTTAGLLSASSSAPTMPTGYTYKALVGAVRNDGSGNFVPFYQQGKYVDYVSNQVVKNGSFTANAWTAQDVTTFFPPTAKRVHIAMGGNFTNLGISPLPTGASGEYSRRSSTSTAADDFGGLMVAARNDFASFECRYAPTLYYYTGNAASTLYATGWEY